MTVLKYKSLSYMKLDLYDSQVFTYVGCIGNTFCERCSSYNDDEMILISIKCRKNFVTMT